MTTDEYKNLAKKPGGKEVQQAVQTLFIGNSDEKSTATETVPSVKPVFSAFSDFKKPLISDLPTEKPTTRVETPKTETPKAEVSSAQEHKPIMQQILEAFSDDETKFKTESFIDESETVFRYIGEAFRTYLIVQYNGSIWFIDKHAAHERILYNQLKADGVTEVQTLLAPVSVTLSREEYRAVCDNLDLLEKAGFEIEPFGTVSVLVRAVPACLVKADIMFLVCDIANSLVKTGKAETEILDDLYHNIACRSAIKGGNLSSAAEMEEFARRIITTDDIMYCPHGRPVAFELKRGELEKQFGRTK
jgi:DNA mismatch repair protein MutL